MHYLIIMSACVVSLERTFAHPSPGEKLIFPNRQHNMTLDSGRNAYPSKAPESTGNSGAGPESLQDLASDKDKFGYIMYAGRIFSALNTDPRYKEMQEKLKNPESRSRALLDFLGAMSNTTRTKLDKIKAEEAQKYLKKCESPKDGTEPPKPDYIDTDHPGKFTIIDLSQVFTKFASMRSLMEKFLGGQKMN
ncbi:unnamed protein product [Bemisia tabaci]|uniref:NUCB1-like N-terminal domain-containing protein n=1 Tax=Bemisia tabaci TaxID=7038 RepID=A0A9P0A8J8_BEMTA|nr:unnamed protein product [Bemisia tabaci]